MGISGMENGVHAEVERRFGAEESGNEQQGYGGENMVEMGETLYRAISHPLAQEVCLNMGKEAPHLLWGRMLRLSNMGSGVQKQTPCPTTLFLGNSRWRDH